MKQNILGTSYEAYRKKIMHRVWFLLASAILCIGCNLVLFFCSTEQTRIAFTVINILCDVLVFSFVYGYGRLVLREMRKKGRLYAQKERIGEVICGEVEQVRGIERVEDFDCCRVMITSGTERRAVFVPEQELMKQFRQGQCVRVVLVNHIAVEVEDDEAH